MVKLYMTNPSFPQASVLFKKAWQYFKLFFLYIRPIKLYSKRKRKLYTSIDFRAIIRIKIV